MHLTFFLLQLLSWRFDVRMRYALWLPINNCIDVLRNHMAGKGNTHGVKSGSGKGGLRANRHGTINNIGTFIECESISTSSTILQRGMQTFCQHIRPGSRTGYLEARLDTTTRMGHSGCGAWSTGQCHLPRINRHTFPAFFCAGYLLWTGSSCASAFLPPHGGCLPDFKVHRRRG